MIALWWQSDDHTTTTQGGQQKVAATGQLTYSVEQIHGSVAALPPKDGYVRARPPVLSLGRIAANSGAGAFCEAPAGNLLAVDHPDRRADWSQRVFIGRGCARRAIAGRRFPGIWPPVQNSEAGDGHSGQSVGWELRRSGGVVPG